LYEMVSWSLTQQALAAGITNGSFYGLVGLGLAIVFRGTHVINVAQGEFSVLAGMIASFFLTLFGLPYPIAVSLAVLVGALIGAGLETLLVGPMIRRGAHEDSFLLLTIGLAFTASSGVLYFAGQDDDIVEIGDAIIPQHAIWLTMVAIAVAVVLRFFYRQTILGLAMMAAAGDEAGAATTGINVNGMRALSFAIGGAVGGLAGVLISPLAGVNYHMGLELTLKGFAAAVMGGLLNPMGALLGGLVLGLLEALSLVVLPSAYKDIVAMVLLISIMILAPNGLLGRSARRGG
jgi:branched-chain amino acid transport system permease protein